MDKDTVIGTATAAGGADGLTLQVVTEFANLALVGMNLALAAGGLYLLWHRIRQLQQGKKNARPD